MSLDGASQILHLGRNTVRKTLNRISVPAFAVERGLFQKGSPVHWGIHTEKPYTLTGRYEKPFVDYEFLDKVEFTKMRDNNVVTIPKLFFPDYKPQTAAHWEVPDEYKFAYDEERDFFTTNNVYNDGLCYVLTDGQTRELLDGLNYFGGKDDETGLVADGGQDTALGDDEEEDEEKDSVRNRSWWRMLPHNFSNEDQAVLITPTEGDAEVELLDEDGVNDLLDEWETKSMLGLDPDEDLDAEEDS
ncbi:hypothetical protein G3I44_14470 [Halogeometricum borinquense]|uniref:Uncharacterized protein n=1 Tax=Halogeometricum borinquense TaxID=60847 RepID=A0A6C0ULZ5_9EURY|nr:hypothetical protein [Halogeometricum borinquense]QIB75391.1 hypothetical protein G3I44_14470 [Halogeometricum borinquense]